MDLAQTDLSVKVLDAIAAPAALIDRQGQVTAVNQHWCRFAATNNYRDADCGLGPNYLEICAEAGGACSEGAAQIGRGIRRVLDGEDASFEFQYPCHSPSEERWYKLLVGPIRLGTGIDGALIQHVEITGEKLAELVMIEAKRKAERADASKSQFIALASHELRTPLNAILGFSEVMLRETFGPLGSGRYREYLDNIHRSGEHLLAIVTDLLELSNIDAGYQQLQFEPFEPQLPLEVAARLHAHQAEQAKITLTIAETAAAPALVADRRAVLQCVMNLLSNAIRYTPAGGRVTLSLRKGEGGVALVVADTGAGMRQEQLNQLFQPFSKGQDPFVRLGEGAGLGLSVVKRLVDLHGGRVTVESTLGQGTAFTLWFPLAPPHHGADKLARRRQSTTAKAAHAGSAD